MRSQSAPGSIHELYGMMLDQEEIPILRVEGAQVDRQEFGIPEHISLDSVVVTIKYSTVFLA